MKIAVISDTHQKHKKIIIPKVDVLVHCGDFGGYSEEDTIPFLKWLSKQDAKYKLLIAGNHESFVRKMGKSKFTEICKERDIIYLEDTEISIEGIKFYGLPWVLGSNKYPFMESDEHLEEKYQKIPEDIDILVSHGPSYKDRDMAYNTKRKMYMHIGSKKLKERISKLKKLKYHFFGHIHESRGVVYRLDSYTSVNAANYDHFENKIFEPFVFEV